MRRVAAVIRVAGTAVFAGGLVYLPLVAIRMLACSFDNPISEIILIVDVVSFPILGLWANGAARAFYQRDNYVSAIACSMIPWLNAIVYVILWSGTPEVSCA